MDYLTAIFLGLLQGFTEFLPVSSSGHLVIASELLGLNSPGVLFETVLHLGTLLAILLFYTKRIFSLDMKYIKFLVIGSIPAGIVGYLFASQIEDAFKSITMVGVFLILTGVFNILIDRLNVKSAKLSTQSSLFIGLAQALAILPGVSRSGATIFAAKTQGIDKKSAAEFSFILSVPAVLGANVLQLTRHGFETGISFPNFLIGFIAAAVSGYIAIKVVIGFLVQGKFKVFGIYALILGLLVIIAGIQG